MRPVISADRAEEAPTVQREMGACRQEFRLDCFGDLQVAT